MNRTSLLIPNYNHWEAMPALLDRLAPYGLPCLIVNDGSGEKTRHVLEEQRQKHPWVDVLHLPENLGKGGAVMAGLHHLHEAGYTHALQMDADGQHDTNDVPKFLAASAAEPGALILGMPVYDASVPRGRLIGRQITRFWVWVETLSFAINDPMVGFRVYPVAAVLAVARQRKLGARMDFDPEIAVRLCWSGLPVRNLETRIQYPPGGLSNFDLLRDNVRISWMHTRLFFEMLPRLPFILLRRMR